VINEFHFIRPLWLVALLVVPLLSWLLWRIKQANFQWQGLIEDEMLAYLIVGKNEKHSLWPIVLLCSVWLLTVLALAGPSWQQLPQPQFVNQKPLIILVDLSPSMLVEDIKPSRLVKMRFKLIDLIKARKQGLTALVVYGGDAHVLTPLSDDSKTLLSLIPTLSPNIMPIAGSRTEEGIELAISLIKDQGYKAADIVLFTDGVTVQAQQSVAALLENSNIRLSIIGVGTTVGAPIPFGGEGFAKDENGNIILAKLPRTLLQTLAQKSHGTYNDLSLSNEDIADVLRLNESATNTYQELTAQSSEMDQWEDAGQWLVLLLLPIFLLSFRRGWLLQLFAVSILIVPFITPKPAQALGWEDLWQTSDQQGAQAFVKQDYTQAADKFSEKSWRGAAQYKAGDFAGAAQSFAALNNADGYYNQGNALAKQGELEEAIKAYNKALLLEPELSDALTNKVLVEKLLKKQKEQSKDEQSKDEQSKDEQSKDEQSKDEQSKDEQSKDEQSKGEQSKDEQSKGEQSKDEQSKDEQSKDEQSKDEKSKDEQSKDQKSKDQQSKDDDKKGKKKDDEQLSKQQLEELQKEQQQQTQQALDKQPKEDEKRKEAAELPNEVTPKEEMSPQQLEKQQQLQNWLGQLPEDASRLVRNKFKYEFQKKRQAYLNGEWQPPKEQRW
jgi:Ca-activated chloride channel family protein